MFLIIVDCGGKIMFNLKAQLRDTNMKAKHLRNKGIIPASIYGRNLKESIMIQIPITDVNQLLSKLSTGNTLTVEVDKEKYNALFKNITRDPVNQKIQQIEFQHIVSDEAVNSVIKIVLTNRDKNQNIIHQQVEEIPYNALPKDFIQEIVIDLDGIKAGTTIKIEDLDISKNENIRISMPEDTVILTVAEKKKMEADEDSEEQQEA